MRKISILLVLLLLLLLTACGGTLPTGTPLATSSPIAATPSLVAPTTSINQIATATPAPIATATQPAATPTVLAATVTSAPATQAITPTAVPAAPTVAMVTPINVPPTQTAVLATATVPPTQAGAPIPTRTQPVSVSTPTQVVATATTAPTLGSEPSLKEFSSSEAKFKILLPEKPVMKMRTESSLIGTINTYEYRLETVQYNESLKFVITATVYPSRFLNRDDIGGLRSVDEIRDNLLTAIEPASSFEGSVVRGAYIGRVLDYQVAGARTLRTEIYPIDSILYTRQHA